MQLIDANVILRYLLADQDELYQHSRKIFEPLQHGNSKALITEGVLVECVYVLLKVYFVPRPLVAEKMSGLLSYPGLSGSETLLYKQALDLFARFKVDIVDALLFVRARREGWDIVSFDKDLEKLENALVP